MHEPLIQEADGAKFTELFHPFAFSVDDQCLFLPPLSEKENWEELSSLYSQMGVVLCRYHALTANGTENEYDVVFNINGTATVIEQIPGTYLRRLSDA